MIIILDNQPKPWKLQVAVSSYYHCHEYCHKQHVGIKNLSISSKDHNNVIHTCINGSNRIIFCIQIHQAGKK